MRRRTADSPNLRGPVACCLLAVAALSLGPTAESKVRSAVRDAARPGFLLAGRMSGLINRLDFSQWPWTTASTARSVPNEGTRRVIDERSELELRRLRAETAEAKRALSLIDASLGPVKPGPASSASLHAVERIAARVLDRGAGAEPGGLIVAAGAAHGVETARPVVAPIALSAGTRDGVSAGATVIAGAAVLGRTDEVGALTATVLPVTAAGFRAHVWIVRAADGGAAFGDEGILEGDGKGGCHVKYVPSTSAVSVGDYVYSRDPTGRIPQPLYYGRIDRADLRDGAPHWEIHLRPVADMTTATEVHVLRVRDAIPLQASTK